MQPLSFSGPLHNLKALLALGSSPGSLPLTSHLPSQVEILACLKWLAEFQILACIPQEVSLPIGDLADLAGVPEGQLRRVIRLTASYGFLKETKPNFVSHTAMSAQFLASQSLCDATVFIAATATPSALQMADATRLATANRSSRMATAYDLALNPPRPFHAACQERSKLSRQWKAYLAHAARSHSEDEMVDTFSRLNWSSLGNACIVEASPLSRGQVPYLCHQCSRLACPTPPPVLAVVPLCRSWTPTLTKSQ